MSEGQQMTPQTRNRFGLSALMMGLAGGSTGLAMQGPFGDGIGGLAIFAFIGALPGGLAVGWAFGHDGWRGWIRALLGGVLATGLGAAIAGTLLWPGQGTIIAPVAVARAIVTQRNVLAVWLGSMILAQIVARRFSAR
jgi:hypothetical protein